MINDKIKKIIEENPVAFATSNNNIPNVIAIAYIKVVSDNEILITDNYMNGSKENLLKNPNVCLAVWDRDWNGYKIIGTAQYLTNGKWFDHIKELPENKDCPAKGAILVSVTEIRELS
jgi:hypothetical protein